jgi:hypothetical protein
MRDIVKGWFLVAVLLLTGCASVMPVGQAYTNITLPSVATSKAGSGEKSGVAKCKSIMALVAVGDCSLDAAKKAGGITTVSHADWKANSILGIVANYTLTVYGE